MTQAVELLTHEVLEHSVPGRTAIFTEQQGVSMCARVVLPRQQPFRVDAELANEGGNDIDEEADIDCVLVLSDEPSQGIRRHPEDGRERVERVTGTLSDGPDAPGDGFDERIVDRQRQARAPLQGIGGKIPLFTANPMLADRE